MGHLTDDITRLCGDILALRNARETLVKDLTRGNRDMKKAVSAMRTSFRDAHAEMTVKTKAERNAFTNGLRNSVADMRNEFVADMAGARRAWFGPTLAERMAWQSEERRQLEAEARRKKEQEERKAREEEGARREAEALAGVRAAEEQKRRAAEAERRQEEELRAKGGTEPLREGKDDFNGEPEETMKTEEVDDPAKSKIAKAKKKR